MYRKANTEGIEEELNQFSEEFIASFEERTCPANCDEFKNSLQNAWNTTSLHVDGTCLG